VLHASVRVHLREVQDAVRADQAAGPCLNGMMEASVMVRASTRGSRGGWQGGGTSHDSGSDSQGQGHTRRDGATQHERLHGRLGSEAQGHRGLCGE
jgi:hypothetical protein